MTMKLNRRNFVQAAIGGAVGLAGSGASLRGVSRFNEALSPEDVQVPRGPEKWSPSLCTLCPASCGLRVRTIGGRAVRIEGNPLHPVNRGGLCPKGLAGLQQLYHPDRLRLPLRNGGRRESPRWRQVHWEEALGTVVGRLRQLRASRKAHAVAVVDRDASSLTGRLFRRFLGAYGSANYFSMPSGLDGVQAALYFQQGVTAPVAYDLERTRYLLSFSVDLLEGWGSPANVLRAFGRWRDGASGARAKFVQAEARYSPTAARADEWLALRPGTEAALALGIAYVLITEQLYDANFVAERTFGFNDWTDEAGVSHTGFRTMVLSDYRLNDVAALTQVPVETILRVAREFGRNRPALAIGGHQTSLLPCDPYTAMAVHSLNALVGSIDAPGGVLVRAPAESEPAAAGAEPLCDAAGRCFPQPALSHLADANLTGQPYPVEAVIVNEADPVFALPDGARFAEALRKVPFVVSFSTFLDDTAALADVVFPAATGLERWQEAGPPPAFPYALRSVTPPVVEPRHGSRNPADVLLEIARGLGSPVAEALPYAGFDAYLRAEHEKLFAAQSYSVFAPAVEETWVRMLERSGWWAPTYSDADDFWKQVNEAGGCWEPSYPHGQWERVLRTPSGRFEFYSQALSAWALRHSRESVEVEDGVAADRRFLPHQPRLPKAATGYPLLLLPVEVLAFSGMQGSHLPHLQQIAGPHLFEQWESWLEINPETARGLQVEDGDEVWVESKRGRARVRARLYAGVRPGVVHMPLGYGHGSGGEWACAGVNPLSLIEPVKDPVAGLSQATATYVKVHRV